MTSTIPEWTGTAAEFPAPPRFVETVDPLPPPDTAPQAREPGRVARLRDRISTRYARAVTRARSDSGRRLDAHLWTIVAVAVALPALRTPTGWFVVCAAVAVALRAIELAHLDRATTGSADVVVVPARVAGRMALGVVNPLNWLRVVVCALVATVAGALAAAAIGAASWLVAHGTDGILAAARMGAWAHAPAFATFVACVMLLRGGGNAHESRASVAWRFARRLPEVAVAGLVVVVGVAGCAFAVAGPTLDVALVRHADGLGWVPVGLRGDVDGLRDDVVHDELDALTACLDDGRDGLWTSTYTAANPLDQADVARLVAGPAAAPDAAALATAALAADNLLAPWVETLQISVGDQVVLVIDRAGGHPDQPVTDPGALAAHAFLPPAWLRTVRPDTATALRCSAATPL